MQRQIEVLKQKAEQGSQQLQGEVQEMELEALFVSKFPADLVEPVPKGEFGGDILHKVLSPSGQQCGTLLWESKRTKNWSDTWLGKLRNAFIVWSIFTSVIQEPLRMWRRLFAGRCFPVGIWSPMNER